MNKKSTRRQNGQRLGKSQESEVDLIQLKRTTLLERKEVQRGLAPNNDMRKGWRAIGLDENWNLHQVMKWQVDR